MINAQHDAQTRIDLAFAFAQYRSDKVFTGDNVRIYSSLYNYWDALEKNSRIEFTKNLANLKRLETMDKLKEAIREEVSKT
jgi:hypothetical protein